jgi:NAD(P)H-dependent FMN reductase
VKLAIILGSARPESRGQKVAAWIQERAKADGRLEIDYVDAATLELPFYNEAYSPFSMKRNNVDYTNTNGKAWAERVGNADGFIFAATEYNHGYTALLKNTIDWVGPEWMDKPVAFVSYATTTVGGARAIEQLRQVVVEVGLVQVANAIHFPKVDDAFDEHGQPTHPSANDNLQKMFDELVRLHSALSKPSA